MLYFSFIDLTNWVPNVMPLEKLIKFGNYECFEKFPVFRNVANFCEFFSFWKFLLEYFDSRAFSNYRALFKYSNLGCYNFWNWAFFKKNLRFKRIFNFKMTQFHYMHSFRRPTTPSPELAAEKFSAVWEMEFYRN